MSEWWTYRLSSFLLFSPRTYYRLFELYNAAIWPAQVAALLLGLAILALVLRPRAGGGRFVAGVLAACWLFVAVAFHALRYATINWGAAYFAGLFAIEAILLAWIGAVRGRWSVGRPGDPAGWAGLAMFLFALGGQPFLGAALGREWRGAEIFGVAPDPTAIATLGLLLLVRGRGRGVLMVVPVLWCAVTGAFLSAMKAPDWWIAPVAAAVAVAAALWQARASRGRG